MSGTPPAREANEAVGVDTVGELAVGGHVPDFELRDHASNQRRLSQLVGGDPTVVHFYRGWWCPKEQAFFHRLVVLQEDAEVAYSRIVSLSVDPPEVNAAFRAGLGARWTFLSDPDREVQTQLRLRETTDTLNHPYVPAVVVISPDLRIHAAYNGYWYWGRPTHDELVRHLRDVSRALRPDWEAPTP
jgi:peroxiredoxin